jgi:folate-binding protein YgfZ
MFSLEQYRALREQAGVVDRSARGRLLLTGADRRTYLQGLLTNDIEALTAGTGCYAALLTPQGRMLADMRVLELGDALAIDVESATSALVRDKLEQFVFSEDVQVIDQTSSQGQVGVYGPESAAMISGALASRADTVPAPSTAQLQSMPVFANGRWQFRGTTVTVVRSDDIGVPGFDLFIDTARFADLLNALRASGAVDVDAETTNVTRVEAGRPLFGTDMEEDTIPLEAGIEERAISLTKGCYVGQEIIIRVLHRGHGRVARRLIGLTLDGTAGVPAAGDHLRSGEREVGRVTSAVFSPSLDRAIALAYVHRDFQEPGTGVTVVTAPAEVSAIVTALPFVSPR